MLVYSYPLSSLDLGLLWALLCGIGDGLTQSSSKFMSGKADRFVLVSMRMLGVILVASLIASLTSNFSFPVMTPIAWLVGIWFGLALISITWLTLVGFKNFDLNLGTIVISSELFFAVIIGYLLYQELPTAAEFVDSLIIMVAIILLNLNLDKIKSTQKKNIFSQAKAHLVAKLRPHR